MADVCEHEQYCCTRAIDFSSDHSVLAGDNRIILEPARAIARFPQISESSESIDFAKFRRYLATESKGREVS
jgi:hypothetical protein